MKPLFIPSTKQYFGIGSVQQIHHPAFPNLLFVSFLSCAYIVATERKVANYADTLSDDTLSLVCLKKSNLLSKGTAKGRSKCRKFSIVRGATILCPDVFGPHSVTA